MRAWKLSPISSSKATLAQNVVPPAGNENRALPKRRNQMRASRQASTDLETLVPSCFFFLCTEELLKDRSPSLTIARDQNKAGHKPPPAYIHPAIDAEAGIRPQPIRARANRESSSIEFGRPSWIQPKPS